MATDYMQTAHRTDALSKVDSKDRKGRMVPILPIPSSKQLTKKTKQKPCAMFAKQNIRRCI
jgi:hypothetical protein